MDCVDISTAAALLGDGVTEHHVRARLRRGTLSGEMGSEGSWSVRRDSIDESIEMAGGCGGCGNPATEYVVVKYHHHDRVEFSLCSAHGKEATLSYGRQGGVLEVISYPLQSEGWLKP